MYQIVRATYQDGVLKPARSLSLSEHEQVVMLILPLPSKRLQPPASPERVTALKEQAAAWLAQQPPDAVRLPLHLPEIQERNLDRDFDAALNAIRAHAGRFSPEAIAVEVSQALNETISREEQAGLEAELDTF